MIKTKSIYPVYLIMLGFVLLSSWFIVATPEKFNSPDENANYFFIKQFAKNSSLTINEPLNQGGDKVVHPRSTRPVDQGIAPGGFFGLIIIYGLIAKLIGSKAVLFITPLLTTASFYFFFRIVKNIFNHQTALVSTVLFALHPAIMYYSSRALFPNVLFFDLLIIGLSTLLIGLKAAQSKKNFHFALAGLLLGAAIFVRPSEIGWVAFFILGLLIYRRSKLNIKQVLLFIAPILIPVALLLLYNLAVYGHPLNTGYFSFQFTGIKSEVKFFVAPFGLNFKQAFVNLYLYLAFFWWITIPALLGLIILLWRSIKKKSYRHLVFIAGFIFISLWLTVFYGGWQISDTLGTGQVTIGTSFTRYWLPIYAYSIPFAAIGLIKVSKLLRLKFLLPIFVIIIAFFSVQIVFYKTDESLVPVKNNVLNYQAIAKQIVDITEEDAVIVSRWSDKIFWPDRKVVVIDQHFTVNQYLPPIVEQAPVYYYTDFPMTEEEISFITEKRLTPVGLSLGNEYHLEQAKLFQLIMSN